MPTNEEEKTTLICPHCKQDTGINADVNSSYLKCPACQQPIQGMGVSKFRCEVFGDEFDAKDKERLEQCRHCLERTDTITCSHLDLIP
jgi:hypothetical protein